VIFWVVTSCWTPWPSRWRRYIPPKHWDVFWTTQHYNPDVGTLHSHRCENLKSSNRNMSYKNARLMVTEGLNEFNFIQLLTEFLNMLKVIFNRIWNHKIHSILFFQQNSCKSEKPSILHSLETKRGRGMELPLGTLPRINYHYWASNHSLSSGLHQKWIAPTAVSVLITRIQCKTY
jgi:hypothetical protein